MAAPQTAGAEVGSGMAAAAASIAGELVGAAAVEEEAAPQGADGSHRRLPAEATTTVPAEGAKAASISDRI